MLSSYLTEYQRYRLIAEKALGQVSDDDLNAIPYEDANSMAMLVRHLSGNLKSRFTDFLTSDGEKPWRHRDEEFRTRTYTRAEVDQMWAEAWDVLDGTLGNLSEDDMTRLITIRGQEWPVHGALARSMAHLAYHVGQMVLLARMAQERDWQWITIPKGQSTQYNQNPQLERGFK